jgi:MoaE-MoaD fusion protein
MLVRVLMFGVVKEFTDSPDQVLDLPEGSTVESLFAELVARYPKLDGLAGSLAMARNQQFALPGEALADGDEIALLPPVSGGTSYTRHELTPEGHFFALTRDPIDPQALGRQILQGLDGALCTFEGVVRNNSKGRQTRYLEYECYEAMALPVMAQIGREVAAAHSISRIAMVHRLGRLEIGEASVVVIAASPHRGPSFAATLEGINRLKKLVPVWKKEFFEDGEVWVEGDWDDNVHRIATPPKP